MERTKAAGGGGWGRSEAIDFTLSRNIVYRAWFEACSTYGRIAETRWGREKKN